MMMTLTLLDHGDIKVDPNLAERIRIAHWARASYIGSERTASPAASRIRLKVSMRMRNGGEIIKALPNQDRLSIYLLYIRTPLSGRKEKEREGVAQTVGATFARSTFSKYEAYIIDCVRTSYVRNAART